MNKPKSLKTGKQKPQRKSWRKKGTGHIYNTREWRKDRNAHIATFPYCVECDRKGFDTEATVSDHIIPINEGGDVWDWSNRQALCSTCHNRKSGRESRR